MPNHNDIVTDATKQLTGNTDDSFAYNGTRVRASLYSGHHLQRVPATAPTDADLNASEVALYLDTDEQLKARVKTSGGTAQTKSLAESLGKIQAIAKTLAATTTMLAASADERVVMIRVVVDETYAAGNGAAPTVKIGETDTVEKFCAAATIGTSAAGTIFTFSGTLAANKALIITSTAATGTATGGLTVTAIAVPAA